MTREPSEKSGCGNWLVNRLCFKSPGFTNAISSVIVVGALLAVGVIAVGSGSGVARFFGFLALILASVNIFGGFLVTQRMLAMYKKKD